MAAIDACLPPLALAFGAAFVLFLQDGAQHLVEIIGQKGFRQVVLKTDLAAAGMICGTIASTHGDRQGRARITQLLKQRPTVPVRKAEVCQEEIIGIGGQVAECLGVSARGSNLVSGAQQVPLEAAESVRMVFNEKDAHRG